MMSQSQVEILDSLDSLDSDSLTSMGRLDSIRAKLSPKFMGATFMLLWALTFSTAMAFAKTLSPEVDSVIVLFMRYFFGLIFFTPFIIRAGTKGFITSRPLLHLLRVTSLGAAVAFTYFTYRNLPLALATSLGMTGPLFTTVLAIFLLKDRVSLSKWAFIFLGYIGVLLAVRPHEVSISIGVWSALGANLFASISIICVKILTRTDSTFTMMLYANTVTTFIAGLVALVVWKTPAMPDLLALIAVGGFGVLSQFCSVTAYKYANPSFLSPFEYTRICFAIPVGFIFFDEVPNIWVILGSLIIIAATYGLTRVEQR